MNLGYHKIIMDLFISFLEAIKTAGSAQKKNKQKKNGQSG